MSNKDTSIQITGVGLNDNMEYKLSTVAKAGNLGENFVLSFYQLDFQRSLSIIHASDQAKEEEHKMIPVAKVAMSFANFEQLREEINQLHENHVKMIAESKKND